MRFYLAWAALCMVAAASLGVLWWLGFWNDLLWIYAFIAVTRFTEAWLVTLVSVDSMGDFIKEWNAGRFLRMLAMGVAMLCFFAWSAWLWPSVLISRGFAGVRLFKLRRAISAREVIKHALSAPIALETYQVAWAAVIAVIIVLVPAPDHIERAVAWVTLVCCLLFLCACVLMPDEFLRRVRTNTSAPLPNLLVIGVLLYVSLTLLHLRLDPSLHAGNFWVSSMRTTAVVFIPGRDWVLPYGLNRLDLFFGGVLIDRIDSISGGALQLRRLVNQSAGFQPTLRQCIQLATGLLFLSAILGPIFKRDLLKRTVRDLLEAAEGLIRLQAYDGASKLLNSIALDERNFRWAVGRAIVDLGRGDRRGTALEFIGKAAEHYNQFNRTQDPELLLYMMAVAFEVPETHYIERCERWMASPQCADEDLWRLVYISVWHGAFPAFAKALSHMPPGRFPLTRILVLVNERQCDQAAAEMAELHGLGPDGSFEQLYMSYHLVRLQGGSLTDWARAHAEDVEQVTNGLRSEDQVRVAIEWVDRLARIAKSGCIEKAGAYQIIRSALVEHIETFPGLTNPDVIVSRVSAAALINAWTGRWPFLQKAVTAVR